MGKTQPFKNDDLLAYTENIKTLVNLIGNTLTSTFEQALTNGQNFFKLLGQALLNLIKKLLVAVAVAALLSFFLAPFFGTTAAGFVPLFKQLSGIDLGGGKPSSGMVAMPSASTNQGGYQVDIMGDKMRLLLDNQAIKNSRVV
jgi:hypothetical protein